MSVTSVRVDPFSTHENNNEEINVDKQKEHLECCDLLRLKSNVKNVNAQMASVQSPKRASSSQLSLVVFILEK